MSQMQKIPVAQQVQQILAQRNALLLRKETLSAQLDEANTQLKALNNVIAGIEFGQQLAAEVAAEQAAKAIA